MVNSKSLWFSKGRGASGKPHSKRRGPRGENHRMPKPVEVRRYPRLLTPLKQGWTTLSNSGAGVVLQN
jgi:hypothetical protein